MYWDDTPSKIDSILQQEDVTLERILDEDDVLQECIANNEPLINFLTKEENMVRMLTIMTHEPLDSENELETYKYPNMICEILTHDGNAFSNLISSNDRYLSILWSFLDKSCLSTTNECSNNKDDNDETSNKTGDDSQAEESADNQPQPSLKLSGDQLNPLLASFFTKVFLYLFTHDNEPVLKFLLSRQPPNDLVTLILRHISTSAIMDFIFKTWEHVNVADKRNPDSKASPGFNHILIENGFVEQLIDVFKYPELESEQQNVANLISDIVRVKREVQIGSFGDQEEILARFDFESEKTVGTLLKNMFECRTKNSIVNGLKIIQALLQYNIHVQNMITQQEAQLSSMTTIQQKVESPDENEDKDDVGLEPMPKFLKNNSSPSQNNEVKFMPPQLMPTIGGQGEHLARCVRNVSKAIHERLDDFVDLLVNTSNYTPIKTTVGVLEKPLGLIRLEVVHLFVALFATSDYNIMKKCSELNILKILTDLFFTYPLNNQLHKYYEQIVGYVFQNYHNFKTIRDKHQANTNVSPGDNETDEKITNFLQLFEISNVLVQQILQECGLVQKILENYANEKVPVKSYEAKIIKEQQQPSNKNNEDSDVEMKEISKEEESIKTEHKKKLVHIRPGYMGHLRLLANLLKERCNESMMRENGLEEMIPQWQEFIETKLNPINTLIKSELVPESRNDINEAFRDRDLKEAFVEYQNEVLSCPNLPDKIELIQEDIGQNPLEIKLKDTEIGFENFRDNKREETFSNFAKYFQMSTKIDEFESELDKPFAAGSSNESSKTLIPTTTAGVILQDFAMFDVKDSTLANSKETDFDDFESFFTNIDAFNAEDSDRTIVDESNPWGMDSPGDSSDSKPVVNDDNWFPGEFVSNDPFVPVNDDELNKSNEEIFASNVTKSSSPLVSDEGEKSSNIKEEKSDESLEEPESNNLDG